MKTSVLIALVGTVAAVALFALSDKTPINFVQRSNWKVEQDFMRFIAEYGRVYKNKAEYEMRLAAFARNMNVALERNQANSEETHGVTEFADWTEEEFNKLLGLLPEVSNEEFEVEDLPMTTLTDVDWSKLGKVAPVKNQGACGSCWAFSAIGAMESRYAIKAKANGVDEWSEQQLVDCSTSYGNHGCNGGWMHYAHKYANEHFEFAETAYPYHAKDESCKESQHTHDAKKLKNAGYAMVAANATGLKNALAQGPVSVAVDASNWSSYTGGVFSNCRTGLNHGVLAVGYDATSWKIKNSWGNRWGEQGYMRLAMGNTCGILSTYNSYPKF